MMGSPEMQSNRDIYLMQRLDAAESYSKTQEKLILELIQALVDIAYVTHHADWRNKKAVQAKGIAKGKLEAAKTHFKAMGYRYYDLFK
jgi:hypothetical protein